MSARHPSRQNKPSLVQDLYRCLRAGDITFDEAVAELLANAVPEARMTSVDAADILRHCKPPGKKVSSEAIAARSFRIRHWTHVRPRLLACGS